jgi:uncharacterized membrane protein (UPF0127 family)
MKVRLLILIALFVLVAGFAFVRTNVASSRTVPDNSATEPVDNQEATVGPVLDVGTSTVSLEIADTLAERVQGLSGRTNLPPNTGLLFIFNSSDYQGIWMKDMLFPLDIIWLDDSYRVVYIESNVSPDTYPQIFRPTEPARYVIEAAAGFSAEKKIHVGDVLKIVL